MAEYYVKTTGDDSTGDGSEGNPWASPGKAAGEMSSGDTCWIQSGTYTMSVNTANVSNGYVDNSTTESIWRFIGYESSAGDSGTPPVVNVNISTIGTGLFRTSAASTYLENITLDGSGGSSGQDGFRAAQTNSQSFCFNVRLLGCGGSGIIGNSGGTHAVSCTAENCGIGFEGASNTYCYAKNCTTGYQAPAAIVQYPIISSIADSCDIGFTCVPNSNLLVVGGIAYNCSGAGFYHGTNVNRLLSRLIGCIGMHNEVAFSVNPSDSSPSGHILHQCADRSNTSGRKDGQWYADIEPISLAADPFTDPDNGDFSLNNDADGGAVLRAILAAMPGVDTDIYPFGTWAPPVGGGSGPSRIRQGNLLGRSF